MWNAASILKKIVCHSLGGLVVKQVLRTADDRRAQRGDATAAIQLPFAGWIRFRPIWDRYKRILPAP
jgi:hypothetical protein